LYKLDYNVGFYVAEEKQWDGSSLLGCPAHNGDTDMAEKLVSNNFKCYA
jgi:hypothetical protein